VQPYVIVQKHGSFPSLCIGGTHETILEYNMKRLVITNLKQNRDYDTNTSHENQIETHYKLQLLTKILSERSIQVLQRLIFKESNYLHKSNVDKWYTCLQSG